MLAARAGSTDTVTRLVETGADVNAKEKAFGQTALMIAAGLDRADVVRLLLARGADWKAASSVADLKALTVADGGRRRAVAAAAAAASADVAGVTRGYRYNELIGTQGGLTALHFAARQGSAAAARALVEGGADVNLASPGDQRHAAAGRADQRPLRSRRDAAREGRRSRTWLSDAGVSPLYADVERAMGADCGVSAAARAPAADADLSRCDEAAARQRRRSECARAAQGLVLGLQLRSVRRR